MKDKHILFVDTLGRLLLGKVSEEFKAEESCEIVTIKNPAIIHAVHKENGGMSITIIPIVFREFLAEKDAAIEFNYTRSSISLAKNPILDARIIGQYEQMFAPLKDVVSIPAMPQGAPAPAQAKSNVPVIKLFDD